MPPPPLEEVRLTDLSDIDVSFLLSSDRGRSRSDILVIRYVGKYRFGSAGNSDAAYMCAMARAGIEAYDPDGVIHDLSRLSYEWGDALEQVFDVAPTYDGAPASATVTGPDCDAAVRTLLGLGYETTLAERHVFPSFDEAWHALLVATERRQSQS